MRCEVRGSKWESQSQFLRMADNREPMYVVLMNGEYSFIHLTNAHEEGGWKVVTSSSSSTTTNEEQSSSTEDASGIKNDAADTTTTSSSGSSGNISSTGDSVVTHRDETKEKVTIDEKRTTVNNHTNTIQKVYKPIDDFSKISRQCIECDAQGCTNRNPSSKCSKCHTVYYCSKSCQRKHWKEHKPDCHPIETMCASIARLDEEMPESTIPQTEEGTVECGICLQDPTFANLVVLPTCQHSFCYLCIQKWKIHQKNSQPDQLLCCPLCRAEIPPDVMFIGVDDQQCKRASQMASRAERKVQGSVEQRALCEEALNIVNGLIERKELLHYLETKARILLVDGQHADEVVSLVEKMHETNSEENENFRKVEFNSLDYMTDDMRGMLPNIFDTRLILATAMEQKKKWSDALDIYKDLYRQIFEQNATPPQQRQIVMGASPCFYEMGMYENSIEIGTAALEMNRHFPGVHKYLALSMKASGDLDSAIDTMNRAVLYETPWDIKNKLEALNLYNELVALKADDL